MQVKFNCPKYDIETIQQKLNHLGSQGYLLDKRGSFGKKWQFQKRDDIYYYFIIPFQKKKDRFIQQKQNEGYIYLDNYECFHIFASKSNKPIILDQSSYRRLKRDIIFEILIIIFTVATFSLFSMKGTILLPIILLTTPMAIALLLAVVLKLMDKFHQYHLYAHLYERMQERNHFEEKLMIDASFLKCIKIIKIILTIIIGIGIIRIFWMSNQTTTIDYPPVITVEKLSERLGDKVNQVILTSNVYQDVLAPVSYEWAGHTGLNEGEYFYLKSYYTEALNSTIAKILSRDYCQWTINDKMFNRKDYKKVDVEASYYDLDSLYVYRINDQAFVICMSKGNKVTSFALYFYDGNHLTLDEYINFLKTTIN